MRPALEHLAAQQAGLFARHQALSSGYTPKEFDRMTYRGGGPWVRVRYGIYTVRESWERLDPAAQARLLDRAALIACDSGTVLSHASAARALGLPLHDVHDDLVHVTRLRWHDRILTGVEAGIKHHGGLLDPAEIQVLQGVPITNAVRTALDVASEFGYRTGLVIADAVLHSGIAKPDLQAAADQRLSNPHHALVQAVVTDADGRAATPIESLCRLAVHRMGIHDVIPQREFTFIDAASAFVDLYSPYFNHVFECDGRLKYRNQVNDRGELLTAEDILWMEKQREDRLRGAGLGVSRFLWADTRPEAFDRVSRRVWREIRLQNAAGLFSPRGETA